MEDYNMAYKFQLGGFVASGSIKAEDGLSADNSGIDDAGAIAGATTISGSGTISAGGLQIAGATVSAAGLALIDDADASAQRTTMGVAIGSDVQAHDAQLDELATMAANTAEALADLTNVEVAYLDGAVANNQTANKALLRDANGLTIQGAGDQNDVFVFDVSDTFDNASLKIRAGNGDSDSIELKALSGISLDGGVNFISATEINRLNTITAGTAAASKAVILDASLDIAGINSGSFAFVSSSGDVKAAQLVVDSTDSFAGVALADDGGGMLDVQFDDSSIEVNANALRVKALGITNDMLAGSIVDSKLSTIATANKVSGTAIQLSANTAIEDSSGLRLKAATAGDGLAMDASQVLSIDLNELTAADVNVAADSIAIIDADGNVSRKESIADLVSEIAGSGIAATNGVLSVSDSELSAGVINVANDSFSFIDADDSNASKKESVADLMTAIAGQGVQASSGVLSVQFSGSHGLRKNNDGIGIQLSGSASGLAIDAGGLTIDANPDTFLIDGNGLQLDDNVAGDGLGLTDGVLSVGVDDSSIETNADALRIKALGVTNGMLAGSIANTKLANSTISGIALGTNLNSLAADAAGGISMTSFNGSSAVSDLSVNVDDSSIEVFSNNLRIKTGGVTNAMLTGSIENSKLVNQSVTVTAGDGLGGGGAVNLGASVSLSVNVDDSSIETNADTLRIKALGVSNAMLGGSIENAKLSNSSVSFGGISVALGASDATPAFDLQDATAYPGDSSLVTVGALAAGSIASSFGDINIGNSTGSFGKIIISGDLEVQGTTTTIDSTTLTVADRIITIGDGLADLAAGVAATAGFEIGAGLASMKLDTDVDGAGLDGFTVSLPLKATSFHGDGAGLSGISADVADTVKRTVSVETADANIAEPKVVVGNVASGGMTFTITHTAETGDEILVKAGASVSSANTVTIVDSSDNIDGQASIILESPHAAVTLIYSGTEWLVF